MFRFLFPAVILAVLLSGCATMKSVTTPPDGKVTLGKARFTVLTPHLIRMEYGTWEDRPSFTFTNRDVPPPPFTVRQDGKRIEVSTGPLVLHYHDDGKAFSKSNLSINLDTVDVQATWRPGMLDTGNLRGTTRTLDGVDGSTELEPGILSRDGWAVVDDSKRLLFDEKGWFAERADAQANDWYFFGHGRDYKQALRDYTLVSGPIPMPPRYVLGTWWSRYWAYSDAELRDLVKQFNEHDVPLDVLVVDMDWHLDGWTGYTWNPKYFPDPDGFLKWCKEQGLKTTLNLHPADGVGKHEAAFEPMARAMRLDPAKTEKIPFDAASPAYMDAYFKYLHHPIERQGLDFWWLDWQQGTKTTVKGLDPLFWLNHLHWKDMETNPERHGLRPLVFTRWGGLGNHRYQIGFSGDTYCNWKSLAFQPYFTATAGNVAYAWWSHDIGGHQPGLVDPELYVRWIQWGALSPVLRTHTTKNPAAERRIWAFPDRYFQAARQAFKFRYELIPMLYTAARQAHDESLPLCRPLYYEWPELDEAYTFRNQYLLGDQLLVAPITEPESPASQATAVEVWLPPGTWTNWFTGKTYAGPAKISLSVGLEEIPLFVRGGDIVVTAPASNRSDEHPFDHAIVHVWPGEAGSFRLYEDDGKSTGYTLNQFAWTPITSAVDAAGVTTIAIGPTEGRYDGQPKGRLYEVRLRESWPAAEVSLNGAPLARAEKDGEGWSYDRNTLSVVVRVRTKSPGDKIALTIKPLPVEGGAALLRDGFRHRLRTLWPDAPLNAAEREALLREIPNLTTVPDDQLPAACAAFDKQVWPRVPDAVWASSAPEAERLRSTLRLLGISATVQCRPGADGTIAAHYSVRSVSDANDLKGRVTLTPLSNDTLSGAGEWKIDTFLANHSQDYTAILKPEGDAPQTTRLVSALELSRHGRTVRVPMDVNLLPSINGWWLIGPFDNPWKDGLDTVFPPEKEFKTSAVYTGKEGKSLQWKWTELPMEAGTDLTQEFHVDLNKQFGGGVFEYAVAYAQTTIHAPRAMTVTLASGVDDGLAVWLNGELLWKNHVSRPYNAKEERVTLHLKQGPNTLLLKISQGVAGWSFASHLVDENDQPVPELRVGPF